MAGGPVRALRQGRGYWATLSAILVMHFYSFYHGLRETAREALALAARLAA